MSTLKGWHSRTRRQERYRRLRFYRYPAKSLDEALSDAKAALRAQFDLERSKGNSEADNVIGFAIGPKTIRGRDRRHLCVKVFVRRKRDDRLIDPECRVPAQVHGVLTDVVECDVPRVFRGSGRHRCAQTPALGGLSVRCDDQLKFGTIACRAKRGPGYFGLTCSHVFSTSGEEPAAGAGVHHPGCAASSRCIGTIDRGHAIDGHQINKVDCVSFCVDPHELDRAIEGVGVPLAAVKEPERDLLRQTVQKSGAGTGVTVGRVAAYAFETSVSFFQDPRIAVTFADLILVQRRSRFAPVAIDGDSGSLLVTKKERRPVGLVIGGHCGAWLIAIPITTVLRHLDLVIDGR